MTLPASVVMMRRHGSTPHDVSTSPYYVATPTSMHSTRNGGSPENGNKPKKSWGERLKLGGNKTKDEDARVLQHQQQQQQHQLELANNNYLLQEYRNKYGTLSNGSALSKSMKYAETWLYGSVRQQQPQSRGNVLHYQQPPPTVVDHSRPSFHPTLIPHITMCSCKEFIGGTVRSKKNTSPSGICKKCGGSRMPWRGGGTLRATVRINDANRFGGTVRVGQSRARPSLTNVNPNMKAFSPDPYDLMRRNRMGVSGEDEVVKDRSRAKSTSPGRHNIRCSPSPPVARHVEARRARRDLSWETDNVDVKRKSILECDVNPYQLIAKYLKNGDMIEEPVDNLDDELSDDMGDNAIETVVNSGELKVKKVVDVEKVKGVTIGGQRMKVFNSTLEADYETDDINDEPELEEEEVPHKHSLIPRLNTPKRPQRRVKSVEGVTTTTTSPKKDEEMESVRSSLNSQIERRSNLVSSNIKSILKKPSSATPGGDTTASTSCSTSSLQPLKTFSDTVREPDLSSQQQQQSPIAARTVSSSNFYLPTFHEYKHEQHRKKKQVQFNDTVDDNSAPDDGVISDDVGVSDTVVSDTVVSDVIQVTFKVVSEPASPSEAVEATATSAASVRLRYFGDDGEDVGGLSADKDKSTMPPTVGHVWRDTQLHHDMEALSYREQPNAIVSLRRSLSDRQVSTGEDTKQEHTAAMFNDTMRLRLMSGRRTDSRQAFSHPGATPPSNDASTTKTKRVLSPGRTRPKEPPPPPPLPPPQGQEEVIVPRREDKFRVTFQKRTPPENVVKKPSLKQLKVIIPPKAELKNVPVELNVKEEEVPVEREVEVPGNDQSSYMIPTPPQLPPRHIFPFTKKQIQNINNQKRHTSLKSSAGSPPLVVLNMRTKSRPNSCIPQINSLTPDSAHNASRIRHRNSDPGPAMSAVNFRPPTTPEAEVNEGVRTVVSVCPDSPDVHRLQIKTDAFPSRRTSILINGDDYETPVMRTSVIIDDSKDSNKVTISVGGVSNGLNSWSNMNGNNNNCTVIGTQGNNSLTRMNHTNQITIPVSPEPVYNQRSNIQVDDHNVLIVDRTTGKSLGTQHDYEVLEMLMDPVEAVRMHLVPHVCGKTNPDGGANLVSTSAMERLNSLLVEQKGYCESSDASIVEVSSSTESSLSDVNKYSNSEKSSLEVSSDQENNGISVHYFTAPRFVLGDEQADEEEEDKADKDIYDDAENIYESIKDPIYEEIGLPDTPPPLPLSPPPSLDELDDKRTSRSIFEGASKYDILNYLVDAKERGYVESDYNNGIVLDGKDPAELTSLGDLSSRVSNLSNASDSSEESQLITAGLDSKDGISRKSSADIERNDSGVGSETSKSSRSRWQSVPVGIIREDQIHLCEDCDQHVETQVTDSGVMYAPLVCRKCAKKRAERKDTIAEIVETEEKYGGDLRIILEEFYRPMLVAGLLTSEQLSAIFLNVEELIDNNMVLAEKLRDALEIALEQGDEDLLTVNIGSLFLEAAPMLHAFESYCTRQGGASLLLANLEKEKELLRIFLRVSQMENAVLRRMNLNSFLMVPVQRVTKYPLLLARLHKVTPGHHLGRELLKQAQHKIELHLEHMNSVAKDISTTKLWRRISIVNGRRSSSEVDMINIKLRKMAVDVLEWNHDEVKFAMEGRMLYTNPTDNNWRKGRTIKLNPINALLVTNGKATEDYRPEDELLLFPKKTGVKEATLLLVKEKCGRYSLLRDPLYLDKCIVCCETDWEDYFEVQELASKDTFIFKAEDSERTKLWYRQLQYHSQGLGAWRRRRNALANIMINGMMTRN